MKTLIHHKINYRSLLVRLHPDGIEHKGSCVPVIRFYADRMKYNRRGCIRYMSGSVSPFPFTRFRMIDTSAVLRRF